MDPSSWWRRIRPAAVDEGRWLVVDVETSGLDPSRDQLIAIAAVAVHVDWVGRRAVIVPGDSFEAVIRQDAPAADHDNVLLHGIGLQHQREGAPAREALAAFEAFVGASPLLAFHAGFDQAVLRRACRAALGHALRNPWADIDFLCAAALGEIGGTSLDDWMDHFGIRCARRHQAAADAMAEADVLLRIWPHITRECASWADVRRLAEAGRWSRAAAGPR